MAIGNEHNGSGYGWGVGQVWNGKDLGYTVRPTPAEVDASLIGVSCMSSTLCVAVGVTVNGMRTVPLAATWDGHSWSDVAPPLPSGVNGGALQGVSCATLSDCTAVGNFEAANGLNALIERWNGSNWTIEDSPQPTGSSGTSLTAVTCSPGGLCRAVGFNYASSAVQTLIEARNGANWTVQASPNPPTGSNLADLTSVSCRSATACVATGSADTTPFSERWNGTSWSLQPVSAFDGWLTGVACPRARSCVAVGESVDKWEQSRPAAEAWDGSSWTAQSAPTPQVVAVAMLVSDSCVSANLCTATGYYSTGYGGPMWPLAERWNGMRWSMQPTIRPPGDDGILNGVSCASSMQCMTVGVYAQGPAPTRPLSALWDGSRWHAEKTAALPTGAKATTLEAVSCADPQDCMAVGYYTDSAGRKRALAERWDGSQWTDAHGSSATTETVLNSVSCPSADTCTAVGYSISQIGERLNLAESWDGKSWRIVVIRPTNQNTDLVGVSCPSSAFCTAAGNLVGRSNYKETLTEDWDGASWTDAGSGSGSLSAVSCATSAACTAVGLVDGGGETGYALVWNGTSWTTTPTLNLPARAQATYTAISCTSATQCNAVGTMFDDNYDLIPFAENSP
jgi:hypothetical protein